MRFISTRIHGMLDYSMAMVLMASPWILGFAVGGAETWVPVLFGLAAIVYNLFTDYEMGVIRRLPVSAHLLLDALGGLLLILSPLLFQFSNRVWMPHAVLGLFAVSAALFTRTTPSRPRAVAR